MGVAAGNEPAGATPTMRRDDRRDDWHSAGPRPYDETDRPHDADVTHEFWGGTRSWSGRPDTGDQPVVDDTMWAERTGSMRAIRDGLTSFKPRRAEAPRRNARGGIDRTRSHGIVRPTDPRPVDGAPEGVLAARRRPASPSVSEATLGELAGGRRSNPVAPVAPDLDWSDEDWSTPTGRSARVAAVQAADIDWPDDDWTLPTGRTARVHGEPTGSVRRHAAPADHREPDDERELVALTPVQPLVERLGLGAVDPLLLRIGVLVLTGALLVGYAFANRTDGADTIAASGAAAAAFPAIAETVAPTTVAPLAAGPAPSSPASGATSTNADVPVADEATTDPVDDPAGGSSEADIPAPDDASDAEVGDQPDALEASTAVIGNEAATVTEPAARVEPDCALTYTANPGDSWYRIADEAGVSPQAVLDANLADIDAVILPGDDICLPEGATMPSPPTTAATTTAAPTTAAPTTTAAPATTVASTSAPTTTAAPIIAPVSTAEVQRLIREIWPDELEERALQIAWRESNYKANAYNGICCYGVFQIHWTSHRGWLDDFGILTTNDLFDARKNITAAYALYLRAGGWGPWGG